METIDLNKLNLLPINALEQGDKATITGKCFPESVVTIRLTVATGMVPGDYPMWKLAYDEPVSEYHTRANEQGDFVRQIKVPSPDFEGRYILIIDVTATSGQDNPPEYGRVVREVN